MPRHPYKKRPILKDPIYQSIEVAKFINYVMVAGRKTVSQKIVYGVLNQLKDEAGDPLRALHLAIANVAPSAEVKPRRLGGASYLVPIEVSQERKLYLALNWIIKAASGKSSKEFKSFEAKLVSEIKEAAKNQGQAVEKKLQTEKLAAANRAFAHLKW